MRNLREYPITHREVIEYLKFNIELEELVAKSMGEAIGCGDIDLTLAKTVLAVINAASTVVQNDIGSTAAELLVHAFESQNAHEHEIAEEVI